MLKIVTTMALIGALLSFPNSALVDPDGCTKEERAAGICPRVSNEGSYVEIGAEQTYPGSGGSSDGGAQGGGGGTGSTETNETCTGTGASRICRPNYAVGTIPIPDVTLADIASFVPAKPSLANEPAGLGVVGMPTNFVSTASEQAIAGRLFDRWDVVVHFVPQGFRYDYGDGTGQTTSSGGASWADLGQAEYTPTSTSHTYSARGTYAAGVTVLYAAWVDFGSGTYRTVNGYVQATTGGYDVRVVEVHTALVDKTCVENPAGPGC